jgi:hypothetical protein
MWRKKTWKCWYHKQKKQHATEGYSWFSRDVIAAMLVPMNKGFLISVHCYGHQHGRHVFVILFP